MKSFLPSQFLVWGLHQHHFADEDVEAERFSNLPKMEWVWEGARRVQAGARAGSSDSGLSDPELTLLTDILTASCSIRRRRGLRNRGTASFTLRTLSSAWTLGWVWRIWRWGPSGIRDSLSNFFSQHSCCGRWGPGRSLGPGERLLGGSQAHRPRRHGPGSSGCN